MPSEFPVANRKTEENLIEIGMILVGRLDRIDRQAIEQARSNIHQWLTERFPKLQWRITLIRREEVPLDTRQEPSALLEDGKYLRDAEGWDFALLFTSADLVCRYKPYALAATSNSLDLAVISTNRIDPHSSNAEVDADYRFATLTQRVTALCLRSLCLLNGLTSCSDDKNLMAQPNAPQALDGMLEFTERQAEQMQSNLSQIADTRLEESSHAEQISHMKFYLKAVWINRHEIFDGVWHAKPWEFPWRLLRLTGAALSSMVILMVTAETWHIASKQTPCLLIGLLLGCVGITTAFVATRQRLFVHRVTFQLSEQIVISNVVAAIIVLLGMCTTALILFIVSTAVGAVFYPSELLADWTNLSNNSLDWLYLHTSLLVSTLGLVIGALGASFEEQHYFRHVVFVDEET